MFQFMYVIFAPKYLWIYVIAWAIAGYLLVFPFCVAAYSTRKGASKVDYYIIEDLLLDCKTNQSLCAQVFYVYNFTKKFAFGIFLAMPLAGSTQLYLLLAINGAHLFLILYLLWHNIPNSRLKIGTRTINLLCVIALEVLILAYNLLDRQVERMILLGVTCTYLAIAVTLIGIVELVIKVV